MHTILIVEDDGTINELLKEALEKEGYRCTQAFSGTEARLLLETKQYDLVLLDLMLPGISGEEVLREIRRRDSTPVIVVTAKDTIDDKVEFLRSGADDYVTKPFNIKEVAARVEVQLRRSEKSGQEDTKKAKLRYQELVLDKEQFGVFVGDTQLERITRQEFAILPFWSC